MSVWTRDDLRSAFGRQLDAREAAIAAGATPIGWKLGFGTPAALDSLQIDAPLIGYLLQSGRLESGGTVSIGDWTTAKIETEIAVYLDADVPAGASREECEQAIGGLSLAFELVDMFVPPVDPVEILEHNVFQRHVVLGERGPAGTPPLVTIRVDGETLAADADPVAAVGDFPGLVGHVADVLGELGPGLRAGDVLITGAVAPAPALAPGEHHEATAQGWGTVSISARA